MGNIGEGPAHRIPDPVIHDPGKFSWWEGQYEDKLDHLKELLDQHHAQLAFMEITSVVLFATSYVMNGQSVALADQSNFNSTIAKYINAIQEDFDQYSSGSPSDPSYANDAKYAEAQIKRLMQKYPEFAKALNDVDSQLDAIFKVPSEYHSLQEYWAHLWKLPQPQTGDSTDDTPAYSGTSVVSNAINASRSDVESQSTVLNSQMQAISKEASKDLAFAQDCFRSYIEMIKAAVNASKNAGG